MAYVGISGQFDGGLTNPSKQVGGSKPLGWGMTPGMQNPIGTKPLPITQPAPPVVTPGVSSPALGGPKQSTDQYWPWPTGGTPTPSLPAPAGGSVGPKSVSKGNTGAGHVWDDKPPALAGPVVAPPIPTGGKTAGPITGAAPGQYYGYTPEKWKPSDIDIPEAGVDTRAIVNSLKPKLMEEMSQNMGNAARRFGALGGLKGTGYATTLGASERKMFEDLNALNYKYDYDAAQADANRKSTARENTLNRELSGYGTYGGLMSDEASRHTGYGIEQQKIANDIAKNNQGVQNTGVQINNEQDWKEYMAGLSEAQRKQMYDQMMLDYGG